MAHYHLETEKGRNGDNAWPLWGLAMRLVTAVSYHTHEITDCRWACTAMVSDGIYQPMWSRSGGMYSGNATQSMSFR